MRQNHRMVQTGARAAQLAALIVAGGVQTQISAPIPPRSSMLGDDDLAELLSVYETLGGLREPSTFRPGSWDLAFDDGLIIELDEELHFNRYRGLTFGLGDSSTLPWASAYARYCTQQETACLAAGRWGKRWTSPSSEKHFGPANGAGTLVDGGAPRWKQRAFYDAMKDIAARAGELRLARLSVWDNIGDTTLGEILTGRAPLLDPSALNQLILARTLDASSAS